MLVHLIRQVAGYVTRALFIIDRRTTACRVAGVKAVTFLTERNSRADDAECLGVLGSEIGIGERGSSYVLAVCV